MDRNTKRKINNRNKKKKANVLTAETKPEEVEERVEEVVEAEPELKKAKIVDDNENEEIPEIGQQKGKSWKAVTFSVSAFYVRLVYRLRMTCC